jgi:signal transduction histidine kinase
MILSMRREENLNSASEYKLEERSSRKGLLSQPHFLGLGLSLLLLIAVATASYSSWTAYEAAADETRNIRANINQLKDLFILLQSAESGQRGFLLTGDAQYLGPYKKAVPEIREHLGMLGVPASTYSFRPALIAQLRVAMLEKLDEMEATIALKQKGYGPAAQAVVTTNRGQVTMDEIRALERKLEQEQDASLVITRQSSRDFARIAQLISTLGSCGIFIIVSLSAIQIHRLISSCDQLISQQKTIEQALQRSNEDLQQFVYSASHDLQEPLRTLMIYSEMLGRRSKGRLDAADERDLRLLHQSAERMRTLVTDLLTYTEILSSTSERGKLADTSAVFHKALANLEGAIRENGAQIKFGCLPQLTIPEAQLLQLFQNLISNALKYRKPNEVPEIEVSARQEDSIWVISVRDNGIGIDPAYHSKIFGLFKRLHTATQYPGTGLGLAICKKIVQRNQGRIWVESEPGVGSTFSFSLPAEGLLPSSSEQRSG